MKYSRLKKTFVYLVIKPIYVIIGLVSLVVVPFFRSPLKREKFSKWQISPTSVMQVSISGNFFSCILFIFLMGNYEECTTVDALLDQ